MIKLSTSADLTNTAHVAARLLQEGASVREIRLHGRAGPAIILNRPPQRHLQLDGIRYAWGVNRQGRPFERHACRVEGIQVQWETTPSPTADNVVSFPAKYHTQADENAA